MEDSNLVIYSIASFVHDNFLPNCPKSTLFGVFDGHGGKAVSERLASILPNVTLCKF
jgi:serine/threonine protein phosphatase PrpC